MNLDLTYLAEQDFGIFFTTILHQKMGRMHREISEHLMTEKRHLAIMAARGHGKTNLLSIAFPIWICWRTPATNPQEIVIQSATMDQSTKILRKIKAIVENNPAIRERLMPESVHQVDWSKTMLEFKNGHRIECVHFGDTIRGNHINWSILDDILTEETTNVEEAKNTFYGAVLPITNAKKGKQIIVGTPMSFKDLLYELSDENHKQDFLSLKYPAIDSEGNLLFPELYSKEDLDRNRRIMPAHLFSRELLLMPVSDQSALFPYETVVRPCVELPYPDLTKEEEETVKFVLGGDVAVSDKERADFSCYMILKLVDGRPMQLFKKEYFKGVGTDEQILRLKELNRIYHFSKMVVEVTGLSHGIGENLEKDPETAGIFEGFDTKAKNKAELLGRLEVVLRNKQIKLPDDGSLKEELSGWEIKTKDGKQIAESVMAHDDQVMALGFAVYAASSVFSGVNISSVERKEAIYEKQPIREIGPADIYNPLQIIGEPSTEKPTYPDIPEHRDNYYNY